MNTKAIAAGQFKAKCLALIDEVASTRRELIITKRGRPLAKLVPISNAQVAASPGDLIEYQGDLVSPVEVA